MKRRNITRKLRDKLDNYFESITDKSLVQDMKKDVLITGGSIASMLLDEEVNDYDLYFKTRETTLKVAEYYCNKAIQDKTAKTYVLHKELEFVQDVMKIDLKYITNEIKKQIKTQQENGFDEETEDELTIDSPIGYFKIESIPSSCQEYNNEHISLRILHNIYNTFKNDEDRIKIYLFGSFGAKEINKIDPLKIDSQEVENEEQGKYETKFISANAITLSDKIQIVTRFYGEPKDIHENFDFVHATGIYDYSTNELTTTTEQLESLMNKSLIYKGSLYPLASIFRARKFIYRGWTIDAGQYLKMAFQLNEMDLLDPYTLEEQLTGVDLLYFYQIVSDLKYKQLTNDDFKPSTNYFIKIIERIFE